MRSALVLLASLAIANVALAFSCPTSEVDLDQTFGAAIGGGSTTGMSNDLTPACAPSTAPEVSYEWVAPCTGSVQFDTIGSAFDTVLALFSTSDCATQLACNDDFSGLQSGLTYNVQAGTRMVVDVDGYGTNNGAYTLNITPSCTPPVCAFDASLGSATGSFLATDSTCGAGADVPAPSCASGIASEDMVYSWIAPADGTYTIDTNGSSFDTTLTVRSQADCSELACNDDYSGSLQSTMEVTVVAGEELQIAVSGYDSNACGDIQLNINPTVTCPDGDGDGVCDADDICAGNDAAGDSDGDGICDDTDFYLIESSATPGAPFVAQVLNAAPGSRVYFLLSTTGPGAGPCHPTAPICAGIRAPRVIATATADPAGVASFSVNLPAGLPHGYTFWLQSAFVVPGGAAAVTEVDAITTL